MTLQKGDFVRFNRDMRISSFDEQTLLPTAYRAHKRYLEKSQMPVAISRELPPDFLRNSGGIFLGYLVDFEPSECRILLNGQVFFCLEKYLEQKSAV